VTGGGYCIVCWSSGRLQLHHLAGRIYARCLVAWVCPGCHRYLHGRLAAGGIDLRRPTLVPAVRAWAVARGVSETFAAALVVLDRPAAAEELRFQARRVGRILVATSPVCAGLSPRPLSGRLCPVPLGPSPAVFDHAAALLALAREAAHTLDAQESS
jgi:hypothetical protein